MKNLSLRYKLFLVLTILILFYAVCSILFVNLYLKDVFRKRIIEQGKTLAVTIASHIADSILIKDFVETYKFMENTMKNNPEVSYIFVEKDGAVLLHTFHEGFPRRLINIGHKKNETDYIVIETDTYTYYDFSAPIFEGRAGTLRMGISGEAIENMLNSITRSLLYVALAAVIVALAFSIIMSRALTKPLSMLTASAMRIADGNYSEPIPVYGNDEIGKLSHAFNKMEDAVEVREKELREINEELETVNIKLHEYIEKLNKTRDELIRAKQDVAVLETSRAMIHHMRQPITYLMMAIEMFTDEIQGGTFNADAVQKKLYAIEDAGQKVSELLKKFEHLNRYKTVEYSDKTRIIDIEE